MTASAIGGPQAAVSRDVSEARSAAGLERFRQSAGRDCPTSAGLLLPSRTSGVRRARSASGGVRSPCQQQSVGRRTATSRLVQLVPRSPIVGTSLRRLRRFLGKPSAGTRLTRAGAALIAVELAGSGAVRGAEPWPGRRRIIT